MKGNGTSHSKRTGEVEEEWYTAFQEDSRKYGLGPESKARLDLHRD